MLRELDQSHNDVLLSYLIAANKTMAFFLLAHPQKNNKKHPRIGPSMISVDECRYVILMSQYHERLANRVIRHRTECFSPAGHAATYIHTC
jgi:hypothetical protein